MIINSKVLLFGAMCLLPLNIVIGKTQTSSTAFTLSSTEMSDGANLPATYTCDGKGISPPLSWRGAPEGTQAFALIMDHESPKGMHWYWTMYNIDADTTQIKSGEAQGQLGTNNVNGFNEYAAPCSKGPGVKTYTYSLYALSAPITLDSNAKVDRDTLLTAIQSTTLASANMDVTYERSGQSKKRRPRDQGDRPKRVEFKKPDLTVDIQSPRCDQIKRSVKEAGFNKGVSVTCNEEFAYLTSSTYPDHAVMTGITGTNEQIPVPAVDYAAPVKLNPKQADKLTTIDAAVGVAVNGVPIYDYSAQGELDVTSYDAKSDTSVLGQLDICGGHSGRGDDYHYHVSPDCMIDTMKNKGTDAIIGWGYDGYPLYGHKNPDGTEIPAGTLDVCNGQTDDTYGYRYQTSSTPPYIIQCLVGEVDLTKLPRLSPLSGDTQKIRADLRPPRGGVENLKHTIADDGARTMTYSYQGEEYFTTYSPSSEGEHCYDFKQRTISNGGGIESGTFCRGSQASDATNSADDKPANARSRTATKPPKPSAAPLEQTVAIGGFAPATGKPSLTLEAWSDNWFAAYIGEDLLIEDSVSITTERSFNAESISFSANYPIQLNLILKDFKENDSGLEYIGARNQQMGDGGFIMQIKDTDTNKVIAVSNKDLKCEVLHKAPLDKACESESDPVAGEGACTFSTKEAPAGWLQSDFDDSAWANATEHTVASVSPKDGYDEINWDDNAQLVWGEDLEQVNTLICKMTVEKPS